VFQFLLQEYDCVNMCSEHGTCVGGYCKCHPGYHGDDCRWGGLELLCALLCLKRKCNPLAGMPEATWERNNGLVSTACACTDIPRNMWIRKVQSKNFQLRALLPAGMISRRWNMDCLISHGFPSIPTIHAMTMQLWNHGAVFHILACQLHVPVNQWNVRRVEDKLCILGGIQVGQV